MAQINEKERNIHKESFFSSIGTRLRSHRLGDLLVVSGVITQGQLDEALKRQKSDSKQVGAILVDLGHVSAVQLYRKLAEQWCLKVSAAGLTFMIGATTFAPTSAKASTGGNPTITLASMVTTTNAMNSMQSYPKLFGSREIKSNNTKSFTKWNSMFSRFESQLKRSGSSQKIKMWKANLDVLANRSLFEKINGVNNYINKTRYVTDKRNYSKSDYWATPVEFFTKGGDCEDYAIAKYTSLKALGVDDSQMRIAIVEDKIKNVHHAVLIVYTGNGAYILDNQSKNVKQINSVSRYKPIFSINKTSWWLHKDSGSARAMG